MTLDQRSPIPARQYSAQAAAKPRLERRADKPDSPPLIVGYAAVFYRADDPGTEYRLYEDTYERVLPGAFDAAIREDVVVGLTNHDDNWVLGRNDVGTLRLSVDKIGLRYEIEPPDTQAGRDTLTLLERGELDRSSFGFRVYGGKRGQTAWVDETRDGRQIAIREIREVELLDVGPVTFAAYKSTTAGTRGDGYAAEARADLDRWRASQRTEPDAAVSIPEDWELASAVTGSGLLCMENDA